MNFFFIPIPNTNLQNLFMKFIFDHLSIGARLNLALYVILKDKAIITYKVIYKVKFLQSLTKARHSAKGKNYNLLLLLDLFSVFASFLQMSSF